MAYKVKQEKYEGPLDLLLDLIEKEKLSITEISLAKITDEYIQYVKTLQGIDPEELAEFLVVAAQLMLVKSRSLLPGLELSSEEEVTIDELNRRLAELAKIRKLAKELKKLEAEKQHIFSRESFQGMDPVFYPPPKLTSSMLSAAFAAFLEALPKIEKLVEEKIKKIISLEERIGHIRGILAGSLEKAFSQIVNGTKEKVEVIVSFLAILELAKQRFVDLKQENLFEDIVIKKII